MNINRQTFSLFILRLSVFVVMLMWTLDKFIRPHHAMQVYAHYYHLTGIQQSLFYAIATLEMLLIIAFVAGFKKRFSYGLVLILHAISTLSTYHQFFTPFKGNHLLFYAAWPMLAACWALYLLRDQDTLLSIN